jgi:predicted nucleotidyltransferase
VSVSVRVLTKGPPSRDDARVSTVHPVARRLQIARRAARAYRANDAVAAVLVAGSVARGLADDASDVELDVYWSRPPSAQERQAAVEGAGWRRVYAEEDEHEWADGLMVDGVKIDVSGFVTTTIDDYLDRATRGDTEAELQVRITALLDGVVVHGEPVIDAWRSRCRPYPEALARAMVEHGLDLRSQERLEMLAARDDVVLLHRDLVDGVQGVLDALFGANRVYAPHPFHKWLEWEVTLLAQQPEDLVARIRTLLGAEPPVAAATLGALVHDTFDLAARLVPAADLEPLRAAYGLRRVSGS